MPAADAASTTVPAAMIESAAPAGAALREGGAAVRRSLRGEACEPADRRQGEPAAPRVRVHRKRAPRKGLLRGAFGLLLIMSVAMGMLFLEAAADEDNELVDAVVPPDFDPELYQDILDAALWTGAYNPDDCFSAPCQNGGTCDDGVVEYTCACVRGWIGAECQEVADPCALEEPVMGSSSGDYAPHDCDADYAGCVAEGGGEFRCECREGYGTADAGRTCFDLDECGSAPCRNGATCRDSRNGTGLAVGQYSCTCVLGFAGGLCDYEPIAEYAANCSVASGGNCDLDLDECASGPCLHGAECLESGRPTPAGGRAIRGYGGVVPLDDFACVCPSGWAGGLCDYTPIFQFTMQCLVELGGTCDLPVDECASSPCRNGAVGCMDQHDGYMCFCAPGYGGHDCETNIDDCASNPCYARSTVACIDRISNFRCVCIDGWGGDLCDQDRDECASSPCGWERNNCTETPLLCGDACAAALGEGFVLCASGQCVPRGADTENGTALGYDFGAFNSYECACAAGFSGADCEINHDECGSSPCAFGNCTDGADAFECVCEPGYEGELCEDEIDLCALGQHNCSNTISVCTHRTPDESGARFACTCLAPPCTLRGGCDDPCTDMLGQGFVTCMGGDCIARGDEHCYDACTEQLGDPWQRCLAEENHRWFNGEEAAAATGACEPWIDPGLFIYRGPPTVCLGYNGRPDPAVQRRYQYLAECPTDPEGQPFAFGPSCTQCEPDSCGLCDCDAANDCELDCAGVWGGSGVVDDCGICKGDSTLCADCRGVIYGKNATDECGTCDDDYANDCLADCFGVWGGSAALDRCGVCEGAGDACSVGAALTTPTYVSTHDLAGRIWVAFFRE